MRLEGAAVIKAPAQSLWDFLLDPQKLVTCVPGCENMTPLGESTYEVTEAVQIGPVSARFKLGIAIVEMTEPVHLFATITGKDFKTASQLNIKTTVDLRGSGEGETQVSYVMDVALAGILARFGEGVVRRKASDLAEKFTENLRLKLENSADT
ncbi:MAG: hypothetical protein HY670_00475 [Chloroflexi bacterium]|nr:hypothetical protein [Chloroflexota bacterium]